jgi:predicted secreted protein
MRLVKKKKFLSFWFTPSVCALLLSLGLAGPYLPKSFHSRAVFEARFDEKNDLYGLVYVITIPSVSDK